MSSPQDWQSRADEWASEAVEQGRPTEWFERLWAAGRQGDVSMPWEHDDPHPVLAEWLALDTGRPTSGRAAVVGCGLGADAEALAADGYQTVGFDLSASAIAEARARHPDSPVSYIVGDLLAAPANWHHGFDLVVEIYTVQAVPPSMRAAMIGGVTDLVAPGGSLLVVQSATEETNPDGPPWPLTREQVESFARDSGLHAVATDLVDHPTYSGVELWRAHLRRTTLAQ